MSTWLLEYRKKTTSHDINGCLTNTVRNLSNLVRTVVEKTLGKRGGPEVIAADSEWSVTGSIPGWSFFNRYRQANAWG